MILDINMLTITVAKQAIKIELMDEAITTLREAVAGRDQMIEQLEQEALEQEGQETTDG